jgi:hypothetical protein
MVLAPIPSFIHGFVAAVLQYPEDHTVVHVLQSLEPDSRHALAVEVGFCHSRKRRLCSLELQIRDDRRRVLPAIKVEF